MARKWTIRMIFCAKRKISKHLKDVKLLEKCTIRMISKHRKVLLCGTPVIKVYFCYLVIISRFHPRSTFGITRNICMNFEFMHE